MIPNNRFNLTMAFGKQSAKKRSRLLANSPLQVKRNVRTTRFAREDCMKMNNPIPDFFLAPCGVNCFACYVHLKNRKACNGCLGSDINKPERCKKCEIKGCATEKGFLRCFDCGAFPCIRIKRLDKTYREKYRVGLIENALKARDNGITSFQETEKIRWTCKACGGIISQHDSQCSECGKTKEER